MVYGTSVTGAATGVDVAMLVAFGYLYPAVGAAGGTLPTGQATYRRLVLSFEADDFHLSERSDPSHVET